MKMTTIVPEHANTVVAAIGDVHGMEPLLDFAELCVCSHAMAHDLRPVFVFLGDLVDRGSGSCEVINAVINVISHFPDSTLILGNHDCWLRNFLLGDLGQRDFDNWMGNGGADTLASYFGRREFDHRDVQLLRAEANDRFPGHLQLLCSASDIVCFGSFAFVHAGVRPGVPLTEQQLEDLRWIREDFLQSSDKHSHVIVHGHTITTSLVPEVYNNRIALDTGAALVGRLSVGLFTTSEMTHLLQCRRLVDGSFDVVSFR